MTCRCFVVVCYYALESVDAFSDYPEDDDDDDDHGDKDNDDVKNVDCFEAALSGCALLNSCTRISVHVSYAVLGTHTRRACHSAVWNMCGSTDRKMPRQALFHIT